MTTADVGMTGDTDPDNPVNALPANEFPMGAVLTVAYGSVERPFCTLGNLYRVVGWLIGDVPPIDGQPANPDADPPQPHIRGLNEVIVSLRDHVAMQLPSELRVVDQPPADGFDNDAALLAWLGGITNKYGRTMPLVALPGTPNNPTTETPTNAKDSDDVRPADPAPASPPPADA